MTLANGRRKLLLTSIIAPHMSYHGQFPGGDRLTVQGALTGGRSGVAGVVSTITRNSWAFSSLALAEPLTLPLSDEAPEEPEPAV